MSVSWDNSLFCQFGQGPVVLADKLIDDVALFHLVGQDFPRIRLHLNVRTERWIGAKNAYGLLQLICGGIEQRCRSAVQRNVEMNPPLGVASRLPARSGGQRIRQIDIPYESTIRLSGHNLMKINILREAGQVVEHLGAWLHLERGTKMQRLIHLLHQLIS